MERLCAISVDLDAIRFYREIHGLPQREDHAPDPVLSVAVRRLADWAQALELPLTWFVVGRDLERAEFAELLFSLCRRGDELANHSLDHLYDLTRRGSNAMAEQVRGAAERLSQLTGKSRFGFRAPGYTMTDELHAVLRGADVLYDSSVFPCPLYYGAKAAALCAQRILGRRSRSILDRAEVLTAPREPYRMGDRYLERGSGVLEFPIQVTRGLRLPFIGTALANLPSLANLALVKGVIGDAFVNLELHGIDALDAADGLTEMARVQPDLRLSWEGKLKSLGVVIAALRSAGYELVTIEQATERHGFCT